MKTLKTLIAAALIAHVGGAAAAQSAKIEVVSLKYHLRGGVMLIDELTLSSFNDRPVKDMVLRCTTSGRSRTDLTEITITLRDFIEPKGVQYFYNVTLGSVDPQSTSMECDVKAAKVL